MSTKPSHSMPFTYNLSFGLSSLKKVYKNTFFPVLRTSAVLHFKLFKLSEMGVITIEQFSLPPLCV